ncbi:hypothetical protein PT974_09789 [Cladobotryum mycophilum]|uniref:Uncharacterized protein n=1 Tax=Cladobotryum mycophilum TaxID=491253 RepID=A0ABR0SII0_9HYPO
MPTPAINPTATTTAQFQAAWDRHTVHNASTRHPVFFTERLRKSPVVAPPGMINSPVAQGYVYQETQRSADGSSNAPKL